MAKRILLHITSIFVPLAVCLPSIAQPGRDSLLSAFSGYQRQAPQEKLFVHIDKTFYLAGETVWFKIYDVDASLNQPLAISGISYIELLDTDRKPILRDKIEMNDGKGNGSFRVPSNIQSGKYTFRAYTNWMKNFSPDYYFSQQLTIFNTLKESATPAAPAPKAYDIRFFPEGGNLVNGLPSVVAFKATGPNGKGIPCQGVLIDQTRDTLIHFQTARFGMGKFTFTPVKGKDYQALINIGDAVVVERLPTAYDQGYTMHLEEVDEHQLRVTVHARLTSSVPVIYLFVHTRGLLKNVRANTMANGEAGFLLNKDSLGDGISHFTVFNGDRQPVCERLYFSQPGKQLHIAVNTATTAYPTRHKITVDLSTTDPSGHPVQADLSMSVFQIDSFQSVPGENILNYLLLTSDLNGIVESPSYYFDHPGPETAEALDFLMLTQGWTRFRWEDVLQNKQPYFEFLPEINGPIINGKVLDKRTGLPPSPVIGYLTVPGKHFRLSTAVSHADGNLWFHVGKFYGNKEIIVQTDSNCRIDLANPFSDRFSIIPASDVPDARKWPAQLLNRSINAQVENAYLPGRRQRLLPSPNRDTSVFYEPDDQHYNLDDYVRFVTVDEVIREIVQDARMRWQSGKAYFRVRNALINLYFDDDPLLLIDGVPVFNADKIVGLDPLKVEKIDVISHRYFLGPSIADGIVSFRSYDGELAGYELDPNALVIQYNGLAQEREFYSPVYDTQDRLRSKLPDFRNQLFWSPEMRTDATGKTSLSFYCSDLSGQFALLVQGLTNEGLPGYAVLTFTVQPPR